MKRFAAGFGKVEITPPLNVPYLGFYPERHRFFKRVNDPLFARSLYISDGNNEVIIISADSLGFYNSILGKERNFTQEVRKKIESITGVSNIMLASSHIHSTPETIGIRQLKEYPEAIRWLEKLQQQIAFSAGLARDNTFRATLKAGRGKVEGISANRRHDRVLDTELIILIFESDKGEKIFLLNFACHPVILQVQDSVSADYVGVLQKKVEETIENTKGCLFLQGACGDINPVKGWTKDFRDAFFTGMVLTGEVLKVFGLMGLKDYPFEPVILKVSSEKILFPSRPLPEKKEIQKIRKKDPGLYEELLERIEEGEAPFEGEIQLIRMGNVILCGIPGEPFCSLGIELKKRAKPFIGIPVGYANGYLGYIATSKAWKNGGYEVDCGPWSKVGTESYNLIIKTFERLKKKVQ